MSIYFSHHVQEARRRNIESSLNNRIKNTYDSAKNYREQRNSDEYLANNLLISGTQTAYARNKLSQHRQSTLSSAHKLKNESINIFNWNSKLGVVKPQTTVDSYPYNYYYAIDMPSQNFIDAPKLLSSDDFCNLIESSRGKGFRKFINYRISLIEAMIFNKSPFNEDEKLEAKLTYAKTVIPLLSVLRKGFTPFDTDEASVGSDDVLRWLMRSNIDDIGTIAYKYSLSNTGVKLDDFMLYWRGYGDVLFSTDYDDYLQRFFEEHAAIGDSDDDWQGKSFDELFGPASNDPPVIKPLPCNLQCKQIISLVHKEIANLFNGDIFKALNSYDDDYETESLRSTIYDKGY